MLLKLGVPKRWMCVGNKWIGFFKYSFISLLLILKKKQIFLIPNPTQLFLKENTTQPFTQLLCIYLFKLQPICC